MIGKSIYHYKILEKLGEGGMGIVYLAEDTRLHRNVAIKFLPPEFSKDKEVIERFLREARAAASLNDHNIVTVHEINDHAGDTFIVMEYVEGITLKKYLLEKKLTMNESANIAVQIGEGLKAAHNKGIVHRDIKPANIIITNEGNIKILDFGIAKLKGATQLTREGSTIGTIAYMSPEQAQGEHADSRSDIWSLGVILYLITTGQLPFSGEYDQALLYSIVNAEPKNVSELNENIPDELSRIIHKAIEKSPEERYQDISVMVNDLKNIYQEKETDSTEVLRPEKKGLFNLKTIAIMILLIVVGIFAITYISSGGSEKERYLKKVIAVLPFENLSGDADQNYFVDGMHDTLLTELAGIKNLRVISRTTMMKYRGIKKTIPEIGKELKAKWIVEGSALMTGGKVRINAQLIEAETDHHLWAEKYDGEYKDIFDLHSEVSRKIVNTLKIKLSSGEILKIDKKRTVDPEVHKAYLKGKFFWNKQNAEGLQKAIDHFTRAIKLDPEYTKAYTGLFRSAFELSQTHIPPGYVDRINQVKEIARNACRKAIELDPDFSESQYSLALTRHYFDWNWKGAQKAFLRALELNPNDVLANYYYSDFLLAMGLNKEALLYAERALELDPLSTGTNLLVGMALYYNKRPEEAIEQLEKAVELDENFIFAYANLGYVYLYMDKEKEAIEWWARMWDKVGFHSLAQKFRKSDIKGTLHAWLELAVGENPIIRSNCDTIAWAYAKIDEKEKAYEWLEKALHSRQGCIRYIREEPSWDFFRSDPKFQDIVKRMRLPKPEDLK
ncbi:MAG: protein kinase [Acidobacteriota bacterium]